MTDLNHQGDLRDLAERRREREALDALADVDPALAKTVSRLPRASLRDALAGTIDTTTEKYLYAAVGDDWEERLWDALGAM